jgi:spermidine synthase
MPRRTWKVAGLLFVSGMCSLVYETVWIRELRLVFGAATSASAAVIACFIGGLGAGGLWLGKRADHQKSPLALYADLEAIIAVSAATTPFLLRFVRSAYILLGGARSLGSVGGAAIRLVLSAVVFAVPTLAMGGTLPAASRAARDVADGGRRSVAVLYGVNTLGAVVGCASSTFLLFELLGNRLTLWTACLVNLLVAVFARSSARALPEAPVANMRAESDRTATRETPALCIAAWIAGFVFCLMELVWYRMLGPLLGGSVFTFGLILCVALGGIGVGGLLYALLFPRGPTLQGFAGTCFLEAVFVAAPYALGDRLAVFAALLRPLGGLGFSAEVFGWTLVTVVAVFVPAVLSGAQFPMLIALLGRDERRLGREVGLVYACNTAGAIAGSLTGGFGLIPMLTAPGCWRVVVWLLVALGLAAALWDLGARRTWRALPVACAGAGALACLRAEGPTAAWRHSPIGAGRVESSVLRSTNAIDGWLRKERRAVDWQVDGRESSIAISKETGVAFIVNGKIDGNARGDAATAVPLGLLGAILHRGPRSALVIGLGTGESAGWLAAVPSVTSVDVAELEPAVVEVAHRSTVMNRGALENPKVHIQFGDAREALLTTKQKYDVIASEPSNPFRTGIASLFTREYYTAVADDLEHDGIFVQWVQGYEVDGQTVRTIYATLASVFPFVETWAAEAYDFFLVASTRPLDHDAARLRARVAEEPFRSALALAWRVTDLEGFFSHYVAGPGLSKRIAQEETDTNTDDQNLVEFGFARSVARASEFSVFDVWRAARAFGFGRPDDVVGVDWHAVDEYGAVLTSGDTLRVHNMALSDDEGRAHRVASMSAVLEGNSAIAVAEWRAQQREPLGPSETVLLATALADIGDDAALRWIEPLRAFEPVEADLTKGRLLLRQGRVEEAWNALESAYVSFRTNLRPLASLVSRSFDLVEEILRRAPRLAVRIDAALREPFVLNLCEEARMKILVAAATHLPPGPPCVSAFEAYEPNPTWTEEFLGSREACYSATGHPLAAAAAEDLLRFRLQRASKFSEGL